MFLTLDIGTSNKNDISNFQTVCILKMFSKIYEWVTDHMIKHMIRLPDEWREGLHNSFVVGGVFMDLSKVSDYIPHAKLKSYGYDDYLVDYLCSYLDNRKQWVGIINKKIAYKI